MCLLNAFIRNGFCPTLIRSGRKILVMEFKLNKLRFLTSNAYFNVTEFDLATQFEIPFNYFYFPKQFIQIENFDYEGPVPNLEFFITDLDDQTVKDRKKTYRNCLVDQHYKWSFRKELFAYCDQKLMLLVFSCILFVKDCYFLQINFQKCFNLTLEHQLNPFSYPLCSLSGYTYKLFKALFMNNYDIYIIKNEFGINTKNVSKIEFEWASFMDYANPEKKFESAFNNVNGQRYFKEAIPDLYSEVSKEALFFNGCVFHGHYHNCLINPIATENSLTPFGKTYKQVNDEFMTKVTNLLINNSQVNEIVIRWECQYKDLRSKSTEIQQFLINFTPHPLYRLQPRTCVRGAYFDVYSLLWSNSKFPSDNLYFLDINGLYSFCAINFPFMIGKYHTLIGKSLENLELRNNLFFYNSNKVMGSILVTILPPQNLFFPFLLYRTKSGKGKTVNTLCRTCCENKIKNCKHSDLERAITSSYMISEIEFALSLNYKLLAIHEAHIYEESAFILKDFIHQLNYLKIKNSGCVEKLKTPNEKLNYCEQLNADMNLKKPFILTPNNIKPNPRKKAFYKLMANALFGKLEQRHDKCKTMYVNSQSELENLFFSENQIQDINCINSEICEVQFKSDSLKLPPNKNSNCYIGAQLTAFARQTIYSNIQKLENCRAKIFQVDCDSIIFSFPKTKVIPLRISDAVGHFKHEIENIISYQSLGPKNYCITFKKDNKIETVTKVRGLSLNNSLNENIFNDELFKNYVQLFLEKKKCQLAVNQYRTKGDFKRLKITSTLEQITFSNTLSERRFLNVESSDLNLFPYGYKKTPNAP